MAGKRPKTYEVNEIRGRPGDFLKGPFCYTGPFLWLALLGQTGPQLETELYDSVAVKHLGEIITLVCFFVVLGRFLAEVGPRTPLHGRGSKDCAERT